jgi:hypothetical protein
VTGTTPADGATGVAPNTGITITFSEPVVPGTVTFGVPGATITITPVPVVAPTLAVVGNTVTLAGGVYSSTATYTVSVAGTVQSLASGALLGSTFTFRFTTRAWTVGPTTLNLAVVGTGCASTSPGDVNGAFGAPILAGDLAAAAASACNAAVPSVDNAEVRGFVAFSLTSLPPNAIVLAAQFTSTQTVTGAPYATLGNLLAEAVNWFAGGITFADFTSAPLAAVVASTAAGNISFDARALVVPQLAQPTAGIRFRLEKSDDGDGVQDTSEVTGPNLTVVYGVL